MRALTAVAAMIICSSTALASGTSQSITVDLAGQYSFDEQGSPNNVTAVIPVPSPGKRQLLSIAWNDVVLYCVPPSWASDSGIYFFWLQDGLPYAHSYRPFAGVDVPGEFGPASVTYDLANQGIYFDAGSTFLFELAELVDDWPDEPDALWLQGNFVFEFGPAMGACCTGSSCNVTSQPDCTGEWLGVDTTCSLTTCIGESIGPIEWSPASGGNGHGYELVVVPEGVTWHEASDMALQMGGHLATLTSYEEHLFVFENLASDVSVYTDGFWGPLFGAYQDEDADDYSEPDGGWRWVTGEPWDWTNWLPGQPDNGDGIESVGQFVIQPPNGDLLGHWNDWAATSSAPVAFIVEYPIRSITWELDDGGNGHGYELVVVPEGVTWHEASDMALQMGGHLATLTSYEEHNFVFERLANDATLYIDGFWGPLFGAYQDETADDYSEPDGGWQWVTGEPWDWTNWLPGQPDNGDGIESVGQFVIQPPNGDLLGHWNDWAATSSAPVAFIVEYTPPCIGNVNDDFEINISDLLTVIAFWGSDDPIADVNNDGTIDVADLLLVISNWGPCP